MTKIKKIYFLLSFVMIIGCYALNKSYSLFVDVHESNVVESTVPTLESSLSLETVTLDGDEESIIKETITNSSEVSFYYVLNFVGDNFTIKLVDSENNIVSGTLDPGESNIVHLYVKNNLSTSNTITFNLTKKYVSLKNDLVSNIDTSDKYEPVTVPYGDETDTLKYHILSDYVNSSLYSSSGSSSDKLVINNGALTFAEPPTKVAEEISGENEKLISQTEDDYGVSYYFRGNVDTNFVNFAGMCWRIVRIDGNGNVKLILEDQDNTCETSDGNWNITAQLIDEERNVGSFGFKEHDENTLTDSSGNTNSARKWLMDYLDGDVTWALSMASAFKQFQTNKLSSYLDKLEIGKWCLANDAYATASDNAEKLSSTTVYDNKVNGVVFYYDSNVRHYGKAVKEPTLKCYGTEMNKFNGNTGMYVGALTADEIVYAGSKVYSNNSNFYLINDYQKNNSLSFWTLSPIDFNGNNDSVFYFNDSGVIDYLSVDYIISFRPSILLKSEVLYNKGDGTKTNPYEIK